jgi:hypothetical protein
LLSQFLLDKLAQVAFVHSCHDQPSGNVALHAHHAHPWRKRFFDFGYQFGGFLS